MNAPRRALRHQAGFTIIEVAIATAVVGIGVVALLHAMGAGTRVNHHGQNMTHAVFLAQEVREWTLQLPFSDQDENAIGNPPGPDGMSPQDFVDDLDDLMDVTYSPPRDGQGLVIDGMPGWSQAITLTWRDPNSITTVVPNGSSDLISVTVAISHEDEEVFSSNWLVTRRIP